MVSFAVSSINTHTGDAAPKIRVRHAENAGNSPFFTDEKTPDEEWETTHRCPYWSCHCRHRRIPENCLFDVWGSTVNVAARLQSVADTKGIVISDAPSE